MLNVAFNPEPYTLIGIDPGTAHLGVSVLQFSLDIPKAVIKDAFTIRLIPELHLVKEPETANERRHARLSVQHEILVRVFRQWQPHRVISESPFMGQFARAFEALVECLMMIRSALTQYDRSQHLFTVDPRTVKHAVGVHRNSSEKNDMRTAVLGLDTLYWEPHIHNQCLNQHAIDAIAVAYYQWQQFQSG